jgi:hypothetical protein
MLPVTLLQSWRQAHDQGPDDRVAERIVAQFFTPTPRSAQVEEAGHPHSRRSSET